MTQIPNDWLGIFILYAALALIGLIVVSGLWYVWKMLSGGRPRRRPRSYRRLTLPRFNFKREKSNTEAGTHTTQLGEQQGERVGAGSSEQVVVNKAQIEEMLAILLEEFGLERIQTMFEEIEGIQKKISLLEKEPENSSNELGQIDKRLKEVERKLQKPDSKPESTKQVYEVVNPPAIPPVTQPAKDKPRSWTEVPLELLNLYNAAVVDQGSQDTFQTRFRPIRIKTANAMQRRRDPHLPPEFQTADDGDYYAVAIKARGQDRYAVMPRFDLTFGEVSYGPGGMGMVFDCPEYDARLQYHRVRVVHPAIFEPDGDQNWRLVEQGSLDLGQGE